MKDTFEYSGDYAWAEWSRGITCALCNMREGTQTEAVGLRVEAYDDKSPLKSGQIVATPVCDSCARSVSDENWQWRKTTVIRFAQKENN